MTRLSGFISMTKPRAMLAVLVTAAAGCLLAQRAGVEVPVLLHLLAGVALSGGGSIVLNQLIERRHDSLMERTRGRSLPTAVVTPAEALAYGIALAVAGTAWLFLFVNELTGWLAALSVVSYVLIYTPLKRVTTLNTAVGAIPGAIPPMMGWTAVRGEVGAEAWLLFAILFVWQFPHFLAIGWIHRQDYGRAGYAMLPVLDPLGDITARQMILNALCLLAISVVPAALGLAGARYVIGALLLGLGLLGATVAFARLRTDRSARWVLKGSVAHIGLLMALMVLDRA